jgi:DNA-binding response OmpR family regulator
MGNILVVDDERSIRNTLKDFLELEGHTVETAAEAESALAILQSKPMDVILTDIILPRVSGVELLRRIRAISSHVPCTSNTSVMRSCVSRKKTKTI